MAGDSCLHLPRTATAHPGYPSAYPAARHSIQGRLSRYRFHSAGLHRSPLTDRRWCQGVQRRHRYRVTCTTCPGHDSGITGVSGKAGRHITGSADNRTVLTCRRGATGFCHIRRDLAIDLIPWLSKPRFGSEPEASRQTVSFPVVPSCQP